MKKSIFISLILVISSTFLFFSCTEKRLPKIIEDTRIGDFGLFDHSGDFHTLYYHKNAEAIVLFVQGNECPIVRNAYTDLRKIRDEYASKNVKFFMINSNIQDNRASVKAEIEDFKMMGIPVLIDKDQLVGDLLDIDITAECFVISPKDWTLQYRGPLNDRIGYESQKNNASNHYLKNALDMVINNEKIETAFVNTKGCAVARLSKHEGYETLTYADNIAPILEDNCYNCHQEGGIAPWAMNNYTAVFGWSRMIKQVLLTQRMPPWHADPEINEFHDDMSLSDEVKRQLVAWIDNGMPKGEGDPLASLQPSKNEYALGTPDLEINLKKEMIPATGIIDYRFQDYSVETDEDLYLKAVEVKPGNTSVLHHVIATLEYPEGYDFPVKHRASNWLDGIMAGWAPGGEPEQFPKGTGKLIPKGSTIHFQMHYTTSGKEESDVTSLGLYFHDSKPEFEFITIGPSNFKIHIKPELAHQPFSAVKKFEEDVTIFSMLPHMHYRGKSMNFTLKYPDGSEKPILSVPAYSFNWQRFYYLKYPEFAPAGTELIVNAVFDNSVNNEFNPNPSETLYFGEQTFDEMLVGYVSIVKGNYLAKGDLSVLK
ncbi:MAG: redoxin domain-containing protein [Saprospiraceae bacterium]